MMANSKRDKTKTRNSRNETKQNSRATLGSIEEPMEIDTDTDDNGKINSTDLSITNDNKSTSNNNTKSNRVRKSNDDSASATSSKQQRTEGPSGKQGWTVVRNPYKKVDSTSANRRLCSRGPSSLQLESTPDRNNRVLGSFNYRTRVTVKLNIEASEDPKEAIMNVLQEFFDELQNVDAGSALLPWKRKDFGKGKIDKAAVFPTDFNKMRTYAPRLFAGKKGESMTIYPNLFIGHSLALPEVRKQLQPWLSSANNGLFRNMLQVESTSEIGFFLYSCREMDAGALADEIKEILGFAVGLRWKTINNGKRNLPAKQQVKALIVEVDIKQKHKCQSKLAQFYRRTTRSIHEYPNGIRLRFVKAWDDAINTSEKKKIEKLRIRQKEFLASIRTTSTYDILDLDSSVDRDETLPTLRQMIMSIRSSDNNTVPLFHSVDLDYTGSGYVFIYSNDIAMEAECVINTLIPYILHFFPETENHIERMFDDEAVDRCEHLQFDATQNQVIDTLAGSNVVDIEVGDELEGFSFGNKNNDVYSDSDSSEERSSSQRGTNSKAKLQKRKSRPEDDDSVSTFGGRSKTTITSPPRLKSSRSTSTRQDDMSVMSGMSSATMESIRTLQQDTENKFKLLQQENADIKAQNSALHSQMSKICQLLESNHASNSTSSAQVSPPTGDTDQAGEKHAASSGAGLQ